MKIENSAAAFPWPQSYFETCLRERYSCSVLEFGTRIHAYGIVAVDDRRAHVLSLCVRPGSQGRGLGTLMLAHLLKCARRRGARMARLEVRPTNRVARRLYERMGFHRAGMRKGYYAGRRGREDALVMILRF